jgi:lysyl-tRNA synthetase, class I
MSSWPIDEARKIPLTGKPVLFETGYGPSGLPHIGTFTEVARTSWVRQAFTWLTHRPSKLLAFSDDMDGFRRVPDNVPNRDMLKEFIGFPLTKVPDPFGTHESFAHHNNAKLREFLDRFGFDYEFASSTEYYTSGRFNDALKKILECHDEIVDVILPTLGKDRAATYTPLMPIHPKTGHVIMDAEIMGVDHETGMIVWMHDGEYFETSVLNGNCKIQWKADWAMRWYALGVDYEMSGKDLIDSVKLSSQICRVMGGTPPINMTYELFLDKDGKKISKSKGNGLAVEDWLKYAPQESLAHYIFANPQRAKKIYLELVPQATDEYLKNLALASEQSDENLMDNPVWYIHKSDVPKEFLSSSALTFRMLLNLVGVANTEDPQVLLQFITRYSPIQSSDFLDQMISCAIQYYKDFIKPMKVYRAPSELERKALTELIDGLKTVVEGTTSEEIQSTIVFPIGKQFPKMKEWFDCLYQVLFGETEGPRFGVFVSLYGVENTIKLIGERINDTQ